MIEINEKKKIGLEMLEEIDRIFNENNIWYSLAYGSALGAYREHGFIEWDPDIDILITIDDQDKVRELLRRGLSDSYFVISCDKDNVSAYDIVAKKGVFEGDFHIDLYPLSGGPDNLSDGYKFQRKCRRIHSYSKCKYVSLKRLKKKWKVPFVVVIKLIEKFIPDCKIRTYIKKEATKYPFKDSKYVFPFANDGKVGEYMEKDILMNTKRVPFENLNLPITYDINYYLTRIYGDNYMTPIKF
ncbi:MAG: LicD family protein [Eubacteriales bacterium]|nr:LicD family protein [Eubacteriales bacterium]